MMVGADGQGRGDVGKEGVAHRAVFILVSCINLCNNATAI